MDEVWFVGWHWQDDEDQVCFVSLDEGLAKMELKRLRDKYAHTYVDEKLAMWRVPLGVPLQ